MIGAAHIIDAMSESHGKGDSDRRYLGFSEAEAMQAEYLEAGIDPDELHLFALQYARRVEENAEREGLTPVLMATCAFAMGFLAGVQAEQARGA